MTTINKHNNICRCDNNQRDWWLPKYGRTKSESGYVCLGTVIVPPRLVGKRVKFKVVVLKDGQGF